MNRREALQALEGLRERLRACGVTRLALFGSVARDETDEESDIDVLVQLRPKTFDRYMDVKEMLEAHLGRPVDLVLEEALKPHLRDPVQRELVHVEGF